MKNPLKFFGAFVVVMLTLYAFNAHAEGDVVCVVTASAVSRTTVITDGGSACSWVEGSTVAMQCDNAKVCYKPDGGPAVVGRDLCADFVNGRGASDAYLITLGSRQKNFSVVLAEAGDGGSTSDCKMALTSRRTP